MALAIVSLVRALCPPASLLDTPAGDSKEVRYASDEATRAIDRRGGEGARNSTTAVASLSAATDPRLARSYNRYLVKLDAPYTLIDPHEQTNLARMQLYQGDYVTDATAAFRAAAWLLGAPYRRHDDAQYGVPWREAALLELPGMIALDHAAQNGYDVRSMIHDRHTPWGTYERRLVITVRAPRFEDLDAIARGLGVGVRLLGEPGFGMFILNRS